jgi:hypothetical protein
LFGVIVADFCGVVGVKKINYWFYVAGKKKSITFAPELST